MNDNNWSDKEPLEEGWFWFYGYPFENPQDASKICERRFGLYAVQVWKIRNGYTYVANGHFMDNLSGHWQKMIMPDTKFLF